MSANVNLLTVCRCHVACTMNYVKTLLTVYCLFILLVYLYILDSDLFVDLMHL